MKIIATAIAAAALTFIAAPDASARDYCESGSRSVIYVSGYARCGTPIYTEKYLVRYNRHGNPMYGYRQLPLHYHGSRGGSRGYDHRRDYGRHDDRRHDYGRDDRRGSDSRDGYHRHDDGRRVSFR